MKKNLTILLLFLSSLSGLKAQYVTVPDANFVNWLDTSGFAACMNGNQMDTTCTAILNTTFLQIYNAPIVNPYGLQFFKGLDTLWLSAVEIDSFNINFPATLQQLDIRQDSSLVYIRAFPASLSYFWLQQTKVAALPAFPNTLQTLSLYLDSLVTIPTLPASLKSLALEEQKMFVAPVLPPYLEYLDVSACRFPHLPALPNILRDLYCAFTSIDTLPNPLPDSLRSMDCHNNYNITVMPPLPRFMQTLYCDVCSLPSLPALPDSLLNLYCSNNLFDSLPALPMSMQILECYNNLHITSLPPLPDSLLYLDCSGLPLITSIPPLPSRLGSLYVSGTAITCVPALPPILYRLDAVGTNIQCLPNKPVSYFQTRYAGSPDVNLIGLCDIFNSNGCPFYTNLAGLCYLDRNNNCMLDGGDTSVRVKISAVFDSTQESVYSGYENYGMVAPLGPYRVFIDTTGLPFTVCPDTLSYTGTLTTQDSTASNLPFALSCKPGYDLVAQSIYGRFRPGSHRPVYVSAGDYANFYNAHCVSGVSGSVKLIINGPAQYYAPDGTMTPTGVSADKDTITWVIPDFGNIDFFNAFNFVCSVDSGAQLGQQVCFTLIVDPVSADYNPGNNILTICFTITNSIDPNEKEVYPAGPITAGDNWLTYTIHFQNTGSDVAKNIYVQDTLSPALDPSTFILLAYSRQPQVIIKGNIVRFDFPNINLPDSLTSDSASQGYVQYKVKRQSAFGLASIQNTASIYFDLNPPVVTNTLTNTIVSSIAETEVPLFTFRIYPNPAGNNITVSVSESMVGKILTITDVTGRKIEEVPVTAVNFTLLVGDFSNGLYFLTIADGGKTACRKLVVNR